MKKKSFIAVAAVTVMLAFAMPSCKPTVKDVDLVNKIESAKAGMSNMSNVNATVSEGVVTLSGTVPDAQTKSAAENNVKAIEGVKSVVNNIEVVAPPPPPAPVEINADDIITKGINDAVKNFNKVKAEVKEGVITLSGEIKRDELPKLMQMMNELKPKNIVNNLTIK